LPADRGANPRVALATSVPLTADDRQLVPPLRALGFAAEPVVWSDPGISWSDYVAVVIRSCWDYHNRIDEFLAWSDRLEDAQVPLINSAAIVKWNTSKTYLLDLAAKGLAIPPMVVVRRGAVEEEVSRTVAALRAGDVVVKPAVSASAHETWRTTVPLRPDSAARVRTMATGCDVIIQLFVEAVADSGELSLVFFDGVYSHAARKVPTPGDFRVQVEHGGRVEVEEASTSVIGQAARVLHHAPAVPIYARVDGIVVGGVFTLMELELIEPELYLFHDSHAPARFAKAIAAAISRGRRHRPPQVRTRRS
jgi:glutathione synthase/RimK-type ligase-like ATP-grasp enzyme